MCWNLCGESRPWTEWQGDLPKCWRKLALVLTQSSFGEFKKQHKKAEISEIKEQWLAKPKDCSLKINKLDRPVFNKIDKEKWLQIK